MDPVPTPSSDPSPPAGSSACSFYQPDTLRPEQSIGYLMRRALTSIAAQVDRHLVQHDLTHAQWLPLYKLTRSGPSPVATLARELQLDPAAVTRALDRLEAKALVRRVRSLTDRRVVLVELTDEGRRQAEVVPGVLADVLNRHLTGFSEAEWQTLVELLQRLAANAEALRDPGCCAAAPASVLPLSSDAP
ncbi:MarR family winged helix-turn-helix transcriptional regulator [Sphaerotilus microaerophilus]|uniref:MarR family transcriptional regulator n=1 Tax=Sphaerotilus microaerophilus TaxID=2914710 RepID=A0ABM7YRX7_9BURK|nr:MarR family transcriptional regulator [Sphaerotilus sp. FB-5]BDI07352.1 MarR family transcriptional regulator [Sphaerotilus sp. FB-5]